MKSSIGDGFFRSYKVSRCPNFLKGVRNCIKCYVSRHVTNTFLMQSSGTFFLAVLLRNAHQRAEIIPSIGGITMSDKGIIVIYNTESNGTKVEVRLIDGNLWLTQEQIVSLYNSSKSNISEHIKHILEEGELDENSVVRNFRTTASDGKQYNVKHYNLEMIIAIGYRVRSNVGTNFRKWATSTLKEYVTKGFALDDDLLKEAGGGRYFKELLARIRDVIDCFFC